MNAPYLHAAMDDMAEFGANHVTAIDLERRIAEKMEPLPREFPAVTEPVAALFEEQPTEAASAVSGIGFENEPALPSPRFAYMLAPAFDRWPRATTAVVLVTLLALWGFAGQLDLDAAAELAR